MHGVRDQADREARFARGSGGRERSSATSMAGMHGYAHIDIRRAERATAYEGQSGSKDRGDSEVRHTFLSIEAHLTHV